MAVRDHWIGRTDEKRLRNLQLVVNNSRFLILPWVRIRNLASTVLSLCARQLPTDWERLYGYRPLLLETLVDAQFRGTSHKASNWTYLGETRGRGRMDQYHAAHGRAVKRYIYPLCRDVQHLLAQDSAPRWISREEAWQLTVEPLKKKRTTGQVASSAMGSIVPVSEYYGALL
jgi:hypothetical protein